MDSGGGPNMLLNMVIRPPKSEYPDDSSKNGIINEFGGK
jgi:pimeloyl-ACP methyl ester carboxylesterase